MIDTGTPHITHLWTIWCLLLTLPYSLSNSNEAICTRDPKELQGIVRIKSTPQFDLFEKEESLFIEMLDHSTVFVDKTLLIQKIIETKEKVIIINAPRKSGKTINLNMLKDFFEIRLDHKLSIYPTWETSTYKFFTQGKLNTKPDRPLQPMFHRPPYSPRCDDDGCDLSVEKEYEKAKVQGDVMKATYTTPPIISKHPTLIQTHLAKYPVIHLDLVRSYSDQFVIVTIIEELINRICYFFDKSILLTAFINNLVLDENGPKETWQTALKNEQILDSYRRRCLRRDLNATEIETSMLTVSQIMHETFGKPVIILIDGYSAILEDQLLEKDKGENSLREQGTEQVQNLTTLMRNFFRKTLIENPHLKKAVLTDTLTINKKDLFADITDFAYYNAIDNDLQEFYGFTENEANMLFEYFKIPADVANQARLFYNGYTMKRNSNVTLYNMESMAQFLNRKIVDSNWMMEMKGMRIFQNRWIRRSNGITDWMDFTKLSTALAPLIDGNDFLISYTPVNFDSKELLYFTASGREKIFNVTKNTIDEVFSLLLEMGFFTNSNRKCHSDTDSDIYIRIPNQEIKEGLKKITQS